MNRRLAVIAFYLGLPAYFVSRYMPGLHPRDLYEVPCLMVFAYGFLRLAVLGKPFCLDGLHWRTPPGVDERQSQVRANALAYSYWVSSSAVVLITLWISASQIWGRLWHPNTTAEWLIMLYLVTTLTSMLPSAFIAWTEQPALLEETRLKQ